MKRNLFLKAIENNELLEFSIGKGDYHIPDREYGGHWILGTWINEIIPLIDNTNFNISEFLVKMISSLIDCQDISIKHKQELLLYHLHVFYYLRKEDRIKMDDIFKCLNEMIYNELNNIMMYYEKNNFSTEINQLENSIKVIQRNGGLMNYKNNYR